MNTSPEFAIRTQNLSRKFNGTFAVQGVSFDIPRGKIFGFIGPSGCGKTTTVRLLMGIYRPTSGQMLVLGQQPHHFSQPMRARIGYMPQLFVLYQDLSIRENLNFTASLYGVGLRRAKRLGQLLDFVELTDHKNKLVRNISGGMQRRLSLAATLVHQPELIFLDEPTAGVDPILRRKFWDYFRELQHEGRTLFVTTQYVGEAVYCDIVGIMVNGRLIAVDTPDRLRHRAFGGDVVNLRTAQLLNSKRTELLHSLPFVRDQVIHTDLKSIRLVVDKARTAMPALVDWCKEQDIAIESIEEYIPPFDDVFIKLVKGVPSHA